MELDDYEGMDPAEHVLARPDMWIDQPAPSDPPESLFGFIEGKIEPMKTDCPPAFYRIYIEVQSNAVDNVPRSRKQGVDPGAIHYVFEEDSIEVGNEGVTIPLGRTKTGVRAPELCFGVMLAGSNLKGDRDGSGTNGVGAKAANIFSTYYRVIINSVDYGKTYTQEWTENMLVRGKPVMVPYKGSKGSTTIFFKPDFKRFYIEKMTEEYFYLLSFLAITSAVTVGVPITINGEHYPVMKLPKFLKTYLPFPVKNMIYVKREDGDMIYEVAVFEVPKKKMHLSFINGIFTAEGGIHVNSMLLSFSNYCLKFIEAKLSEGGKKKDTKIGIDKKSIANRIGYFVNAWLPNPAWGSQSKTKLKSWKMSGNANNPRITKVDFDFDEEELAPVSKWGFLNDVIDDFLKKKIKPDTGAKLTKRQNLKDCTHANYCSGNWEMRKQCTLIVTEGKSAVGYFKHMKALKPSIMDIYGVLPFRGKCLNTLNASPLDFYNNKEFTTFRLALNLGVPGTDYSIEKNFRQLRYSSVLMMADSDVDGYHITALVILFFFTKYPTLFARGFVQIYRTPILRAKKGKENLAFYSSSTYRKWIRENDGGKGWDITYYKGLGTSNREDVRRDCMNPRRIICCMDKDGAQALELAFKSELADQRKFWICSFNIFKVYEAPKRQPISEFVNYELIEYPVDNLKRSIPSAMDGQKRVHRKILYALLKKRDPKFSKAAQLALICAKNSGYHNGDTAISDTLIAMCQTQVGSSNIPLIEGSGSFATRDGGNEDAAAARYPNARLALIVSKIFRKEDNDILIPTIDECKKWEPEYYLPITNIAVTNGVMAVSTGYSTFIPNHHPIHVIDNLCDRLCDREPQELVPWYQGYRGEIAIEMVEKKHKDMRNITDDIRQMASENEEMEKILNEIESTEHVNVFYTRGVFEYDAESKAVLITELPIFVLVDKYVQFLFKLIERGIITDFRNLSADEINIELYNWNYEEEPSYQNLNLFSARTLSNMYLLDINGMPRYYPTVSAIMDSFYNERLRKYTQRKKLQLKKMMEERQELINRRAFVHAVYAKTVDLCSSKKSFLQALDAQGIPHDIPKKVAGNKFTKERVAKLDELIIKKEEEYTRLKNTRSKEIWYNELQELREAILKS